MEPFLFTASLGASFVLALGMARVLLGVVLRVTGMANRFMTTTRYGRPRRPRAATSVRPICRQPSGGVRAIRERRPHRISNEHQPRILFRPPTQITSGQTVEAPAIPTKALRRTDCRPHPMYPERHRANRLLRRSPKTCPAFARAKINRPAGARLRTEKPSERGDLRTRPAN